MQTSLFDYFEIITRGAEGSVAKLSLLIGMDATWPLIFIVIMVFFIGIFFPGR